MKAVKSIGEKAKMFKYEDGNLYWVERPRSDFPTQRGYRVYNSRFLGKKAAPSGLTGTTLSALIIACSLHIALFGKCTTGLYRRGLRWIISTQTDRIAGIENLRLATKRQNGHNTLRLSNLGSMRGVSFDKRRKKKPYSSKFTALDGTVIYLGTYATAEEAHEIWRKVAKDIGGEFVRT